MARIVGTLAVLLVGSTLAAAQAPSPQEHFGGASSNGLIRDQARAGIVPYPDAFQVEGMLAEHHFPVRQERCEGELCVLTAMGHGIHRPSLTRSAYLLVEAVSGREPETFRRPPLNVSIVIDRSGSMSGWKLSATLSAVQAVISQLRPHDRLSIVTFDDQTEVVMSSRRVTDKTAFRNAVEQITPGGGTDIYSGLRLGFQQVAAHAGAEGIEDRVILLTDQRPNVGSTETGSFQELVGQFARDHIGLTVLGVGLDLGADLANAMSQMEGGTYHYLESAQSMSELFERRFDSLVTPVAYRVSIRIEPGEGLRVADVFGVPGDNVVTEEGAVTLRASTLFYDPRRSGIVIRLEPTSGSQMREARAEISYSYVSGLSGRQMAGGTTAAHRARVADSLAEFESGAHYRAYALVNFAQLLRLSLHYWHVGQTRRAYRILRNARNGIDIDSKNTGDAELADERELADNILHQMERWRNYR